MSLKGGLSSGELFDTIDDARKGNKEAINKLSQYVEKGIIPAELYNESIEEYGATLRANEERKKKTKNILCIILCVAFFITLVSVAVVYHNNVIR